MRVESHTLSQLMHFDQIYFELLAKINIGPLVEFYPKTHSVKVNYLKLLSKINL